MDTEIPSTSAGVLKKILAKDGDVIQVGKPIAIMETEGEVEPQPEEAPEPGDSVEEAEKILAQAMQHSSESVSTEVVPRTSGNRFYSPLVRNIAKEEGISVSELDSIDGTGKEGRVTKSDVLSFLEKKKSNGVQVSTNGHTPIADPTPAHAPLTALAGEDEVIEMDRMRKMIAARMVESKATSPHVTSFVEADMTNIVKWRNAHKHTFMERYGQTLTFTPIIIEAVVKAIKDFPMINIQVDGDNIIKKGAIHMGMAVALPTGNLIVPVIHNAHELNLVGLTTKVNDLAKRARENKLKPDELSGGTYTVSNVGSFGNVMGTPIIVQPQVAIMAIGAIRKKPAVIETPEGDFIGIRHKMFLSHSYDHRVVDGALGGMMVRK